MASCRALGRQREPCTLVDSNCFMNACRSSPLLQRHLAPDLAVAIDRHASQWNNRPNLTLELCQSAASGQFDRFPWNDFVHVKLNQRPAREECMPFLEGSNPILG